MSTRINVKNRQLTGIIIYRKCFTFSRHTIQCCLYKLTNIFLESLCIIYTWYTYACIYTCSHIMIIIENNIRKNSVISFTTYFKLFHISCLERISVQNNFFKVPGDAEDLGWEIQIKHLVCLKSWQMVRFCAEVRNHNLQLSRWESRSWRSRNLKKNWEALSSLRFVMGQGKDWFVVLKFNFHMHGHPPMPLSLKDFSSLLTYIPGFLFCMDLSVRIYFQQRNLARNCAI